MKTDLSKATKYVRTNDGIADTPEDRERNTVIKSMLLSGNGHIYTYSETELGFIFTLPTDSGDEEAAFADNLKAKLLKADCAIFSEGDHEFSVTFPAELLDTVAIVVDSELGN